jgi:hypothetical protein
MEQAMTLDASARPRVRVAFARLLQTAGWAGLAGVVLVFAALVVAQSAMAQRHATNAVKIRVAASASVPPLAASFTAPAKAPSTFRLPSHGDVPILLARLERAAVGNGLPWTAGDYRLVPASERLPAALEVRCAFKAPYPNLRAMLAEILGAASAVTFREMSFTRATIDAVEVDARFAIVIYLADDDKRLPAPASER